MSSGAYDQSVITQCAELLSRVENQADRVPAIPFLHDTTTKNVIVTDEGDFSGILDVDDLCYGDPRLVAALTLASLTGSANPGPADYVGMWMEQAGWTDDRLFRVYVALYLADFMGEHGMRFNGNQRAPRPEQIAALQDAFALAVAAAK